MSPRRTGALTAALIALAMLVSIGSAQADALRVNDRDFRGVWPRLNWITPIGTVTCPLTVVGSFHSSTISKTQNSLIAVWTSVQVNDAGCVGGGAGAVGNGVTVLTESLPWHILYKYYTGMLPSIEGLGHAVIGLSFAVDTGFPELLICLYRSTIAEPLGGVFPIDWVDGQIDAFENDETSEIDATDTGAGTSCDNLGINIANEGTGTAETGSGLLIFINLV